MFGKFVHREQEKLTGWWKGKKEGGVGNIVAVQELPFLVGAGAGAMKKEVAPALALTCVQRKEINKILNNSLK